MDIAVDSQANILLEALTLSRSHLYKGKVGNPPERLYNLHPRSKYERMQGSAYIQKSVGTQIYRIARLEICNVLLVLFSTL